MHFACLGAVRDSTAGTHRPGREKVPASVVKPVLRSIRGRDVSTGKKPQARIPTLRTCCSREPGAERRRNTASFDGETEGLKDEVVSARPLDSKIYLRGVR